MSDNEDELVEPQSVVATTRNRRRKKKGSGATDPVFRRLVIAAVVLVAMGVVGVGGYYGILAVNQGIASAQLDSAIGNLIVAYQAYTDETLLKVQNAPQQGPNPMAPPVGSPNMNWDQFKTDSDKARKLHDAASRVLNQEAEVYRLAFETVPSAEQIAALVTRHKPAADALALRQNEFVKVASNHRNGMWEAFSDLGKIRSYREQNLAKWSAKFAERPGSERILTLFEAFDWQLQHPDRSHYAWLGRSPQPLVLDIFASHLQSGGRRNRTFAGNRFAQLLIEAPSEEAMSEHRTALQQLFPQRVVYLAAGGHSTNERKYIVIECTLYPVEGLDEVKPYLDHLQLVTEMRESNAALLRPKADQKLDVARLKIMPEPKSLPEDFVPWPGGGDVDSMREVFTVRYRSDAYPDGFPLEKFKPAYHTMGGLLAQSSWFAGDVFVQFGQDHSVAATKPGPLPDFAQFAATLGSRPDLGTITKTIPEKRLIHFRFRGDLGDVLSTPGSSTIPNR